MEKNNPLQQLKRIKKVDTPPFLFTRIEQKVRDLHAEKAPLKLVLSVVATFCILLLLNISLLNNSYKSNQQGEQAMQNLIEEMNMDYSNYLYYE